MFLPNFTSSRAPTSLCTAVLAVCLLPSFAQAEVARYRFTAVITQANNDGGVYGPVGIGSKVTGFFEINPSTGIFFSSIPGGVTLSWMQTVDVRVAVGGFDATWTVLNVASGVDKNADPDMLTISLPTLLGGEQPRWPLLGGEQSYWPLDTWELKLVGTPDLLTILFLPNPSVPSPLNLAELVLNQSTLIFSYDEGPSFVATLTSIVPEPASTGLMAFAVLGLLTRRRRN
jgi:hypothetical protein